MKTKIDKLTFILLALACVLHTQQLPAETKVKAMPHKVGVLMPLSGSLADFGKKALEGMQIAAEPYKNQIQLIIEDAGNPEGAQAVSAAQKLISRENVEVLITGYQDQTMSVAPLARRANIPVVSLSLCSKDFKGLPELACSYASTPEQLAPLPDLLKENHSKKLVLFMDESGYASEVQDYLKQIVARLGVEIVYTHQQTGNDADFRSAITKSLSYQPDTVMAVTMAPDKSFSFFKQLNDQGFKGTRLGFLDIDDRYIKEFGASIYGVILPGYPAKGITTSFSESFEKTHKRKASLYEAQAHDVMFAVIQGLLAPAADKSIFQRIIASRPTAPALEGFHYRADATVTFEIGALVVTAEGYKPYNIKNRE